MLPARRSSSPSLKLPLLPFARALGSAHAWSDRKQKERVNNGGVLKLLSQLYLALTLHRAIAQRTLAFREGHRNPLNTPWFGVSPHLLCLVPCP